MALTVSPSSVAEDAGATSLSVGWSMSGSKLASSRTMTVSVGSASKNVTLPANKTSASGSVSLTYTPSNNDLYEGDRTVPVTGRAGDVSVTGTSLTIKEDEDPPTVSFSSSSRTVDEDSSTVSLTVALSGASGQAMTVDYATADGTAKAGSDYTATSGMLTFRSGEKSKTVSISITNDSIDENNETFTVSLSDPSGAMLGSADEATVTIIDDDPPPKISLSSASRTVSEGAGRVSLTVRLSQGSGKSVKVDYATTDGTASSDSDYTAGSGTLTFAPGESSQTISVSIKDDSTDEPNETLLVRLSSPTNATLGSTQEATLTIRDNDPPPTITISPSSRTVSEGAGEVNLTVSLSEQSGKEVKVSYATADDTASSGSDYTARSGTLTYAPGQDEKTISVSILEDSAYEYDEDFTVTLSRPSNATLGGTASSKVTIRDNDDPDVTVSYVSGNYQATEGGSSATVTVRLSARPERSVTIPIRVTRKAGASSGDYSGIPSSVTFGSSDRAKTFTVTATDDAIDDDGEWLELSFGALPSGVTEGSVATERVDLIDNDVPSVTVSYASADYQATEGGSAATVTVNLSAQPERSVTVPISASGRGGATPEDYKLSASSVTFSTTQTSRTFTVTANDDSVDDDGEWVSLSFGALPDGVTEGGIATERVDLIDDEPDPTVTLALSHASIPESGGESEVTASLSHASSAATTVTVSASPVSPAKAGDFTQSGTTLTIAAGETHSSGSVTITANGNAIDEDDRQVTVSARASNPQGVAGDPAEVILTIEDDDDPPAVSLSSSSVTVDEDAGSVSLTASLSDVSGKQVTVGYATANGTATSGSDYTAVSGTLTFAAGTKSQTVSVAVVEDSVYESDETFTIRLSSPSNATLGSPASATVTIRDNDLLPVTVSYASADYRATEGGAKATVTVNLSAPPGRQVVIPIAAAPQDGATAQGQPDADYSRIPASVTFGATDTSKTFTVTAVDDSVDDDGEWVSLGFGSLPDGVTAGSVAISRVALIDDDAEPRVTLAVSPASITEHGGVSAVTASLSHPSGADTTLTVRASPVSPASPADGGDFTLSGTTLTIAAGETDSTGSVTITAVDNAVHAPDKTVTVSATASNPQGVADLSDATLTIEEDDVRGVQVSVSDLSLYEGESGAYTVGLTSQPTADVTVDIGLAAQPEADVSPAPWRLTFTPENWNTEQTVKIKARDDADAGSGEVEVAHFIGGGDYGANGVTAPPVAVWVSDDDVTASFSKAAYTATEGRSPAGVEVTLNAAPGREVAIPILAAAQGGATPPDAEGADYSDIPGNVTFARDEQSKTFVVTATEDETAEEGERVGLRLGSLPKGVAASGRTAATIHLKDDPGPASTQVTLSVSPSSVAESAGATPLTVTGALDGAPLAEEAVVSLWLTPGLETEEADYKAAETLLKITAGETRGEAAITLAPVNDTIVEGIETVGVDGLVSVGRADSTIYVTPVDVTIDDDDAPAWTVTLHPSTIAEQGGSATLTLSTGGVTYETDQTIDLAYTGSATLGADFNAPGSVTLTRGSDAVTAKVTAVADSASDPEETITVTANHKDAPIGTAVLTLTEGVCGRTGAVRDAIVAAITGVSACEGVTAAHLSGITELDFFGGSAAALTLQSGDFAGLSGLQTLILKSVTLSSLPAKVFDGLTSLNKLNLKNTGLTALPSGVFDDLSSLTELTLENNPLGSLDADTFANLSNLRMLNLRKTRLSALPGGLFGNLSALTELNLRGNVLATLAADAFGDLTALQTLNLISNRLTAIPHGLFAGLTQLTTVRLDGNAGSPFPLTVRLEKLGDDQIKAVLPTGAPFDVTVPLSVSGPATIDAAQVTIATGAVESDPVTISRNAGTTDAVTADIGALPALPGTQHQGYALTRSADLPLAVLAEVAVSPTLSVSDPAEVKEGDTSIPFTVTLTPASSGTVTVDYATHDGTATAGEDYTAVTGTLTFAAGDTSKTVTVTVLNDIVDEGKETFTLKLSNPEGATVSDGEATATIANSDPIPQAWLVRFGRTVAGHVAEGVSERLMQAERPPAQAAFAGVRLPLGDANSSPAMDTHPHDLFGARPWDGGYGWPHQGGFTLKQPGQPPAVGMPGGVPGASRGVTSRDLLLGSAFTVALERKQDDARVTLWGRGMATRFDGADEELRLDGEAATYLLGADRAWGRWVTGVALAHSRGAGGYNASTTSERGDIQSTLTSVHPYARYAVSERITAWGLLGYGQGALTLNRQGAGSWNTDTSMTMAAAGARGVLKPAAYTGGLELAVRTDALFARTASSASENDTGRLAGSDGHAQRMRFMLEGSRTVSVGARTLTPTVELGLRHDAGDAETGTGVEIGAGLRFDDPSRGLSIDIKVRGLIAHQDAGYREWGASAAIRLDPGTPGQGLMVTLTPAWGDVANGTERLWAQPGQDRIAGRNRNPAGRMDAELSYVSNGLRGLGRQSPYAALSLGDAGDRTLRMGWRLGMGTKGNLDIEGTRRQKSYGSGSEHELSLRASITW